MVRQYIGARYVPRFTGAYDATKAYDGLDVVDNGTGNTYIATKPVPPNTPLSDTNYWLLYGSSSGAIVNLQSRVGAVEGRMDTVENDINGINGSINEIDGDITALKNKDNEVDLTIADLLRFKNGVGIITGTTSGSVDLTDRAIKKVGEIVVPAGKTALIDVTLHLNYLATDDSAALEVNFELSPNGALTTISGTRSSCMFWKKQVGAAGRRTMSYQYTKLIAAAETEQRFYAYLDIDQGSGTLTCLPYITGLVF